MKISSYSRKGVVVVGGSTSTRVLPRRTCRVLASSTQGQTNTPTFPKSPERQMQEAVNSVLAAWKNGAKCQRVEILLPLIGATDLDDWPGGIQQQFKAAQPLVETLLRGIKAEPGLEGPLGAEILDMGDAVGKWESEKVLAVLFPSGSTLPRVIESSKGKELCLLINPQWTTEGGAFSNVVSDFGFFPWQKKAAEDYLANFEETFYFRSTRVDSENLRIYKAYPGRYTVFSVDDRGEGRYLGDDEARVPYPKLKQLAASFEGSRAAMGIIDRMYAEADYLQKTMAAPPAQDKDN